LLGELLFKSVVEAKQGFRHQLLDAVTDLVPNVTNNHTKTVQTARCSCLVGLVHMAYVMVIAYRCLCSFGMVSHQIVMIDTDFIYDVCSTEKIITGLSSI
jgi:hypothetical protein